MDKPEFDTEWQNEAVCPHCGHRHQDTWEMVGDGQQECTETECHSCSKPFMLIRHVSVDYSTKKLEPANG